MEWIYYTLILVWYFLTGSREGLLWSKKESWLGLQNHHWNLLNILFGAFILILSMASVESKLLVLILGLFSFVWLGSNAIRNFMSVNNENEIVKGIDYHGARALEGLGLFIPFWCLSGSFLLTSAFWIFGNWGYKKLMNKIMFNNMWHYSGIRIFRLFGEEYPYQDWYYDLSLIFGVLAVVVSFIL